MIYHTNRLIHLLKKFSNTYRLCNNDNERFVLLLRKRVYPYEYMNDWNKSDETELPLKNEFDSDLNMSNISDKNYNHGKSVFNIFNMRYLKNLEKHVLINMD